MTADRKVFISYAREDMDTAKRLYCRFFITLLSSDSLSKRGYVQKELKLGLDVLDEYPADDPI